MTTPTTTLPPSHYTKKGIARKNKSTANAHYPKLLIVKATGEDPTITVLADADALVGVDSGALPTGTLLIDPPDANFTVTYDSIGVVHAEYNGVINGITSSTEGDFDDT